MSFVQPHLLGKWDLKDLFESVSLERAHGHNQNMSYHEYVAAVMHDRVDIKSSRLDLVFSFLDPDNTGYITFNCVVEFLLFGRLFVSVVVVVSVPRSPLPAFIAPLARHHLTFTTNLCIYLFCSRSVISAESIRSALGEDLSEEELRAMILAGDRDGDSLVSKK